VIDGHNVNDEEKLALKKPIIDACVKSAQKNGWRDAMGILRGTLFLESEPMSLDALAEKTGYSKTTVRSNIGYLENLGMVRRVVDPVGRPRRYKQHRYALEKDTEAMRPVVLSAAMLEIHFFLQALNQIEKDLEGHSEEAEEMSVILLKTKQFYEEMDRILHLMDLFTLKELIEILEKNKK
jgi:DNA-binding transcriptional regulator GbsR (MarR family)